MVVASSLLAVIVGGAFAVVLFTITELRGTTELRRASRDALVAADTLEKRLIDLETGLRGFVITRDDGFLEPADEARAAIPRSARALERLTADEPVQLARVKRIARGMDAYVAQYALPLVEAVRRNEASARGVERTIAAKRRVDALRESFANLRVAERVRISVRDADVDEAARRATAAAVVGVAGSVLLIIVFVGYLTRVIVRPLRRAAAMADRLAGGDLSARMRETDIAEIGALGRSFNVMAGSLKTSRDELASLLAEQAALRRVATLVAGGAAPAEVFSVTAGEVRRLLDVNATAIARYEPSGSATLVALDTDADFGVPVGATLTLEGDSALGAVFRSGRAARQETYQHTTGTVAELARAGGLGSSVGAPIAVDGRLWGVVVVSSRGYELPADTEQRLGDFAEIVASAIANTDARSEVQRLAEEQTALRRVATLVARETAPKEVLAAVADELMRLFGARVSLIGRLERDETFTIVANRGTVPGWLSVGSRVALDCDLVLAQVMRSGQPARADDDSDVRCTSCSVAVPITVNGVLWGALGVATEGEQFPPDAEQRMSSFTELVATAISNVQARTDLSASRARLVAATDEERRRVVRDLHDGAQQRLVHTVITLKLARRALEPGETTASMLLAEALQHAERANVELHELAHGILPSVLTQGGLRAGVQALASRMPVPVVNDVSVDRLPAAVEATAYFVVAEALTNVAKHAQAGQAEVQAWVEDHGGELEIRVRDDGVGGARADGSGLVGLADRLSALDGRLRVESPAGGGTLLIAAIPLAG
jgi:signal transduction histidine kinase